MHPHEFVEKLVGEREAPDVRLADIAVGLSIAAFDVALLDAVVAAVGGDLVDVLLVVKIGVLLNLASRNSLALVAVFRLN